MAAWARGRSRRGPQKRNARRARPPAHLRRRAPGEGSPGANDGAGRARERPPSPPSRRLRPGPLRALPPEPRRKTRAARGLLARPRALVWGGVVAQGRSPGPRVLRALSFFSRNVRRKADARFPHPPDTARREWRAGPGRPAPDLVWPGARGRPRRLQRSWRRTAQRLRSRPPPPPAVMRAHRSSTSELVSHQASAHGQSSGSATARFPPSE